MYFGSAFVFARVIYFSHHPLCVAVWTRPGPSRPVQLCTAASVMLAPGGRRDRETERGANPRLCSRVPSLCSPSARVVTAHCLLSLANVVQNTRLPARKTCRKREDWLLLPSIIKRFRLDTQLYVSLAITPLELVRFMPPLKASCCNVTYLHRCIKKSSYHITKNVFRLLARLLLHGTFGDLN